VLVGADGGLVIALLRQPIYSGINERMAIAVPDISSIDALWNERRTRKISLKIRCTSHDERTFQIR